MLSNLEDLIISSCCAAGTLFVSFEEAGVLGLMVRSEVSS
jgi:hypothetical protein